MLKERALGGWYYDSTFTPTGKYQLAFLGAFNTIYFILTLKEFPSHIRAFIFNVNIY